MDPLAQARPAAVMAPQGLEDLIRALRREGYHPHAPVYRRGSLAIAAIESAADLPRGLEDEQEPGAYRLRREGPLFFRYTVPPDSWKRLFLPHRLRLWRAERTAQGVSIEVPPSPQGRLALLGVRGCDLAAIAIQDRVFLGGAHPDPAYRDRRRDAFIVAVNCARAASTCFCVSMGSGPRARAGFDLALTELVDGGHRLLVEAGSDRGREVMAALPLAPARAGDRSAADEVVERTASTMVRSMPAGIRETLRQAQESPHWEAVADRCLACGNCTLVCPTCFCTAVEDTTDLSGAAERSRRWDSCFTSAHSHVHGGSVHASTASRYRQWMTHKLSTWVDQFDTPGCSGCGRCMTWCPVAIDITEEARVLSSERRGGR